MASRSVVQQAPSAATSSPRAHGRGPILLDSDDVGERLLSRIESETSPRPADETPALTGPTGVVTDRPPRWFAGYRLRFTCDLEILDESH